jgi:hypothetical protein
MRPDRYWTLTAERCTMAMACPREQVRSGEKASRRRRVGRGFVHAIIYVQQSEAAAGLSA